MRLREKISDLIDSPEKTLALSKTLEYQKAYKLNKSLIEKNTEIDKILLWWNIKDKNWNPISWVKIKNLLSNKEIYSDDNWLFQFEEHFVIPNSVPVILEKKWYGGFSHTFLLDKIKHKWENITLANITLKKADVKKIIVKSSTDNNITFSNNWKIKIKKWTVVNENTWKDYTWIASIEITAYSKDEILNNESLLNTLRNI